MGHLLSSFNNRMTRDQKDTDYSRFLESRDKDFDTSRAFLVLSMILAHVFESFYAPNFNRHYILFIGKGFVFLAGFTAGAIYAERFAEAPFIYFKKFFKSAVKLIFIFLICNIGIMLIRSDRQSSFAQHPTAHLVKSLLLGLDQSLFGFDILVPISITIFLSCFILSLRARAWTLPVIVLLLVSIWFSEKFASFDLRGMQFTLVGLIGTLTGKWISSLNWYVVMERFSASGKNIWVIVFILFYYALLVLFTNKYTRIAFSPHVLPTVALLYAVYVISRRLDLTKVVGCQIITMFLSRYMLFAYLFHIALINFLFLIIPRKGLAFIPTCGVAIFVLGLTLVCSYLLDYSNKQFLFSRRLYDLAFK